MNAAAGQEATVDSLAKRNGINVIILPQTATDNTQAVWCPPKHLCGLHNIPIAYMVENFSSIQIKCKRKQKEMCCSATFLISISKAAFVFFYPFAFY